MSISAFEFKLLPLSAEDTPPPDYRRFLIDRKTNAGEGGQGVYCTWLDRDGARELETDFQEYLETDPMHYGMGRTDKDIEEVRAWIDHMKQDDRFLEIYLAS